MDPEVSYALQAIGYAASSHVMARASYSLTGRHEIPLTADLADMFSFLSDPNEYLVAVNSASRVQIDVVDLPVTQEKLTGADLLFVVWGKVEEQDGSTRALNKLALAQAKRLDYDNPVTYCRGANLANRFGEWNVSWEEMVPS